MSALLQHLINAVTIGSTYALVAVGFNLIMGVLRVVYMSHAAVLAASAYVGFAVVRATDSVALAVLAGTGLGALLGYVIERVAIRPVRGQNHLIPLVTSASVAILIEEVLRLTVNNGEPISYPTTSASQLVRVHVAGYAPYFTLAQAYITAMTLVLVVVLTLVVQRTWLGRSIRAVADSEQVSSLLGLRVNAISAQTMAIASALAGAGGVVLALSLATIEPRFADTLQFKAVAIGLFAGMGSIPGAVIGGYLLGFIEALAMGYLDPSYRDLFAYLTMIAILTVRPQGLMGRRSAQRV